VDPSLWLLHFVAGATSSITNPYYPASARSLIIIEILHLTQHELHKQAQLHFCVSSPSGPFLTDFSSGDYIGQKLSEQLDSGIGTPINLQDC
jgi:hypothetical protein